HRGAGDAGGAEGGPGDDGVAVALVEGRLDVAIAEVAAALNVGVEAGVRPGRAERGRLVGSRHRGQRVEVDEQSLGGVGGPVLRVCDHGGQGFADARGLVGYQDGAGQVGNAPKGAILEVPGRVRQVGGGPYGEHAGHVFGGSAVNALDA